MALSMATRVMLFLPVLVTGMQLHHPHLDSRAVCVKDNCYNALTHTTGQYSTRKALQDCSSFQTTTVTPATSTVTEYPTTTATGTRTISITDTITSVTTPVQEVTSTTTSSTVKVSHYKRQATTHASIPAYASSACSINPESKYSSACSCLGVTATTITVATPLTTTTSTVTTGTTQTSTLTTTTTTTTAPTRSTTVSTYTTTPTASSLPFRVKITNGYHTQQYWKYVVDGTDEYIGFTARDDVASADLFYIQDNNLYSVNQGGKRAVSSNSNRSGRASTVLLDTAAETPSGLLPLICDIDDSNRLFCNENGYPAADALFGCYGPGNQDVVGIGLQKQPCTGYGGNQFHPALDTSVYYA